MNSPAEFVRLKDVFGWSVDSHLVFREGRWVSSANETSTAFSEQMQSAVSEAAENSWWYRTRNDLIFDLLEKVGATGPLWEVGSGSGLVAAALEQRGQLVVAIEPGAGALLAGRRSITASVESTLEQLQLPERSLAAVGLFDVLEHLDDPAALLVEIRRVLAREGKLLVTVPALQWLWSDADEEAGHRCRYSAVELTSELTTAGFRVHEVGYRFASLVLPLALGRTLPSRLGIRRSPDSVYKQLARNPGRLGALAARFERKLGSRFPFGTSVFAIASRS
jgi:SAM-dependent methyltransferase